MQIVQAEELERIRRAYHIEHKSIRAIAREMKHSRSTVAKAIAEQTLPEDAQKPIQLTPPQQSSVFGPHQSRVEELLSLNEHLPPKQHYTSHKIFEIIQSEGYTGCESRIRKFMAPIMKHDLVVLDELGFIPFTKEGAQLLFQHCSDLYERASIIVTTNLRFGD